MGTNFSEIRSLARALLEDYNAEKRKYSDEALDSQIVFQALQLGIDYPEGTFNQTTAGIFDQVLTAKQKLQLSLMLSIRIVSGRATEFSHKSVVLAVTRKGGQAELLMNLQDSLAEVNGDRFVLETDSDLNTLVQGYSRLYYGLDRSLTAYDGH